MATNNDSSDNSCLIWIMFFMLLYLTCNNC
jgi:hypothetical protein